jgi:hypothetical protein
MRLHKLMFEMKVQLRLLFLTINAVTALYQMEINADASFCQMAINEDASLVGNQNDIYSIRFHIKIYRKKILKARKPLYTLTRLAAF